jgi:hypothetical protein
VILDGAKLRHSFTPAGSTKRKSEALADPDDITVLGHHLFSGFQNGAGPQTDAISIYHHLVLVSASAPGSRTRSTTRPGRVALAGPSFRPQGMVFISRGWIVTPG